MEEEQIKQAELSENQVQQTTTEANSNNNVHQEEYNSSIKTETTEENGKHEDLQNIKDSTIKKKKKKDKKKKKKEVIITDEDFEPIDDFTQREGFVYDPEKAEFDINEVHLEKRPWEIPDVRSIAYLRRLERRHNKLVHGLASVRKLTPKQIFKEEMRELTKYNEEIREEIQRERIRNGNWEYYDNDVHYVADIVEEMDIPLLNEGEPTELNIEEEKEEDCCVC